MIRNSIGSNGNRRWKSIPPESVNIERKAARRNCDIKSVIAPVLVLLRDRFTRGHRERNDQYSEHGSEHGEKFSFPHGWLLQQNRVKSDAGDELGKSAESSDPALFY